MPKHEHFEELCALLPIGQLSAEEYEELSEHLRACGNCRHATEEFSLVLDQLPNADSDVDDQSLLVLQGKSYRERFLKRATAEGVPFSNQVLHPVAPMKLWRWPRLRTSGWMAFAAASVVFVLSIDLYHTSHQTPLHQQQLIAPRAAQPASAPGDRQTASRIAELEATIATLQRQADEQKRTIIELDDRLKLAKGDSGATRAELVIANGRLAEMQSEAEKTSRALVMANADLTKAGSEKDQLDSTLVAQQFKITELTEQVKGEAAAAERERQLTQAAQEVRGMMGARNLHIIDVSDVDSGGKSKKSFGRVFFTEGQSLIFYAFDLGHKGNAAKVSFQAWGQWEGQDKVAKNLGVFYIDDNVQRRWVLKVNDPEKLKAINSLFVTVEPLGGTDHPTGKKLLYAYLGTQANHP
jgi:hypothetical protein